MLPIVEKTVSKKTVSFENSKRADESESVLVGKACDKLNTVGIEPEGFRLTEIDPMFGAVRFTFVRVILKFHSGIIPIPPE